MNTVAISALLLIFLAIKKGITLHVERAVHTDGEVEPRYLSVQRNLHAISSYLDVHRVDQWIVDRVDEKHFQKRRKFRVIEFHRCKGLQIEILERFNFLKRWLYNQTSPLSWK